MEEKKYSQKWQDRFEFFELYGAPNTPEYKARIKEETSERRILFGANLIAFFFGFIYFFVLGLWKKNLVLMAIAIGVGALPEIAGIVLPPGLNVGISICLSMMWSITANYAYYLKEVKGLDGWNPFEGIRLI
ncbi:DUF2628 domain-containing protein [Klebsiella aerogenes]|uniref:DUF2628 domain-containing protein n=1 Tax=Klebsiella aerogenes TaxID=548 RepID=UPI002DB6DE55|nr:DUF2628 domain-containing protein [Klebsiella aerogenes]MEB5742669.1 DUF2628 domain-containing protein [Klebsiella aerogenes]